VGLNKFSLTISLLLHILILLHIDVESTQDNKLTKKKPNKEYKIKLIPQYPGEKVCESGYIGIGLTVGYSGEVYNVAYNSPAWVAGIRKGDILKTQINIFSLVVGQILEVTFMRGTTKITKFIKVSKICTS